MYWQPWRIAQGMSDQFVEFLCADGLIQHKIIKNGLKMPLFQPKPQDIVYFQKITHNLQCFHDIMVTVWGKLFAIAFCWRFDMFHNYDGAIQKLICTHVPIMYLLVLILQALSCRKGTCKCLHLQRFLLATRKRWVRCVLFVFSCVIVHLMLVILVALYPSEETSAYFLARAGRASVSCTNSAGGHKRTFSRACGIAISFLGVFASNLVNLYTSLKPQRPSSRVFFIGSFAALQSACTQLCSQRMRDFTTGNRAKSVVALRF